MSTLPVRVYSLNMFNIERGLNLVKNLFGKNFERKKINRKLDRVGLSVFSDFLYSWPVVSKDYL
jgi:hypothetical protein